MRSITNLHYRSSLRAARFVPPYPAFIALMAFIALIGAPACAAPPIFWAHEISAALDARDSCYRAAGIDGSLFQQLPADAGKIHLFGQDTTTTWWNFLKGLTSGGDDALAALYFTRAMAAAGKDPGLTWGLAVEFDRCGMLAWEEKCLKRLELLFLTSGARAAPVIVQQLLYKASNALDNHNGTNADFYSGWAQRFDRQCLWPAVFALERNGILDASRIAPLLREMWTSFSASWETQFVCARALGRWLAVVLQLVITGILIGLGFKYLSPSLHLWSERFPDVLPSKGKFILTLAAFGAIAFLGFLPFIWVFFFIIWRRLAPKDKRLGMTALILFLLIPLEIRLNDMFDQILSPYGSVELYKKVINEGYYGSLETAVESHAQHYGNDYLAQSAAALCFCKKGTPLSAVPHLALAQAAAKDDPIVLTATGNTLYYTGNLTGAKNAYQQCISLYPGYAPPYFNLGQYFYATMETAKGMEYTTQATRLHQEFVDAFIKKNDDYFSKDWPPLRQLMWPDFTPGYFWKNVFPNYCGSWETAELRFGSLFLGLPMLWYMILSAILFVLLLVLDAAVWSKDMVKRVASCKVCQKPVCRKCKRGSICNACFTATQNIRNEQIRQRIMEKIQRKAVQIKAATGILLNVVFPGAGFVYQGAPAYQSLPLLCVTSMAYSLLLSLFHATFEYPEWAMRTFTVPLYAVIGVYAGIFAVRAVVAGIGILRKRGN